MKRRELTTLARSLATMPLRNWIIIAAVAGFCLTAGYFWGWVSIRAYELLSRSNP